MQIANGSNKIQRRPATKAKMVRVSLGLRLLDVEAITGVDAGAVSQYENRKKMLAVPTLQRLAAGYGCTIDDLIEDDPRGSQS